MAHLPTAAEVRARAEQLSLIEPGADLPRDIHRSVSKLLLEEEQAPAPLVLPGGPAGPDAPVLLQRLTQEAVGGFLQVDVLFIPTPTKGPHNG